MYKRYFESLAVDLERVFEKMTCLNIHKTTIRKEKRPDVNFPLVYTVEFRCLHKRIKGAINLVFTDVEVANSVAVSVARKMGIDDDQVGRDDYLNELLNTSIGIGSRSWEKMENGLSIRISPPYVTENMALNIHHCGIEASIIIMKLDIGHLLIEVVFIDSTYEVLSGKKILVADDSLMIRQMLSRKLSKIGFNVEVAVDGREAVEKFKAFGPDLVIMDQVMPNLSGLDAIIEIKGFSPDAQFIIFTSSANKEEIAVAKTLKVGAYLIKPLDFPKIYKTISKVLTKKADLH